MSLLRETLGSVIRDMRQSRGLSLRQFAARAELSPTFLGEIERGLKDASSETLERIAQAFVVPVSDMIYSAADRMVALDRVSQTADDSQTSPSQTAREEETSAARRLVGKLSLDDVHFLTEFGEFLLGRHGS